MKKEDYTLNKVEGFNPFDYIEDSLDSSGNQILSKRTGKPLQHMSTIGKLLWFKKVYPEGIIKTVRIKSDSFENTLVVCYEAQVYYRQGEEPITWQQQETVFKDLDYDSIVSKIQTIALGKALSKAGFGCEIEAQLDCIEKEESQVEIVEESEKKEKKKKASSKKKEEEVNEMLSLLDEAETEANEAKTNSETDTESVKQSEEPENETANKLKEALATIIHLEPTAKANLAQFEGVTFEDALKMNAKLADTIKNNERVRKDFSKESQETAIFISDNLN